VLLHTDFTLAPLGALAIIAALRQKRRSGVGQFIEVAQYEAGTHLLDTELLEYLVNGYTPPRPGNRSREMAPHGFFPCAGDDRWVAICARDTVEWLEICKAMDRLDLLERPDLRSLAGRKSAEDEIEAAISGWTSEHDEWELTAQLQQRGVPAGPLEDIADLVEKDPSMRGFFMEFDHPTANIRFMAQNQPYLWNGERLPIRRAPMFGEHNDEVYRGELGLGDEEVAKLVIDQVIY
jgi:benzylsuccinate CoA-transferase BbsF subunit